MTDTVYREGDILTLKVRVVESDAGPSWVVAPNGNRYVLPGNKYFSTATLSYQEGIKDCIVAVESPIRVGDRVRGRGAHFVGVLKAIDGEDYMVKGDSFGFWSRFDLDQLEKI